MTAAEIRDHETGLVSGPFSWFQSRQIFHETHETGKHYIFYFSSKMEAEINALMSYVLIPNELKWLAIHNS